MRRAASVSALLVVGLLVCVLAGSAQASRSLTSEAFLKTTFCNHCPPPEEQNPPLLPPPEGQLEDPCGLAFGPGGIYVSDYYHRAVDIFMPGAPAKYSSQIALPGGPITGLGINELDGVCGLAFDSSGNLYANEYHEGVLRLEPSEFTLDSGESTGVAVDAAGDVFVDDRTYVAEYEAPVHEGDQPSATIGAGTLGDGYGMAVSADGNRVYVADAAADAVKVYRPAVSLTTPQATINYAFGSLVDSALAIDATVLPEHLLVLDNLQPGYEHPEAAVEEFEAPGGAHPTAYAFVGQVKGPPGAPIVDGEPSGLAVDGAGNLFVTDGNSELGNAFAFGPYAQGAAPAASGPSAQERPGTTRSAQAGGTDPSGALSGPGGPARPGRASASQVIQRGGVRVSVNAQIAPRRLPRYGSAPIHFSLSAGIASTDGSVPPQLRRISVKINRHGHLEPAGLPVCDPQSIQPSTTEDALRACGRSLVGEGRFSARVLIAQQAPFPSSGKIVAFNGRWHGQPAILAHVYGSTPVPTSYTLPFLIGSARHGPYGTTLSASLPRFTSKWGYVTGISLNLGRSFFARGRRRSYLSAGCPAPKGFHGASFSLAQTQLAFDGRQPIAQTLTRSCAAR